MSRVTSERAFKSSSEGTRNPQSGRRAERQNRKRQPQEYPRQIEALLRCIRGIRWHRTPQLEPIRYLFLSVISVDAILP